MYTYVYVCVYIYVYIYIYILFLVEHVYVHLHICMYVKNKIWHIRATRGWSQWAESMRSMAGVDHEAQTWGFSWNIPNQIDSGSQNV